MRISAALMACIAIAMICASHAAEPVAAKPPATIAELDAALAKIFRDGAVPGASVALVEDGQITFVKGYGIADKSKATPVTPETVFRAASISKSFTGIAVMTAVQDGKLSLDGRLAELAPDVKFSNPWEATNPIRLVNLIEHTTGWPDISFRVLTADHRDWTLMHGVQVASSDFTSRWQPGHFAVYNNAGPAVAGVILEKATGQEFNTYMRERILRPMGIAAGDFEQKEELFPLLSKSYEADGAVTPFQHIILAPAGSLTLTARELAQLVRFYLGRGTVDGRQILTPQSIARIERSSSTLASPAGFAEFGYGLGNTPFTDKGAVFRGHNGGIDSFTSVYGYSLSANAGYVLMANGGEGVDFGQPAAQLVQAYLTRNLPPRTLPTATVDQRTLESYAGVYRAITPSNRFTRPYQEVLGLTWFTVEDGKFMSRGNQFIPTAAHLFRRADREAATLAFVESEGNIYKVSAFNATVKEPLWRVVIIAAVLGLIVLGVLVSVIMSPFWLVAVIRGRLSGRGGALLRFLPLLSVIALILTFALPFVYLASGSIPSAMLLAVPGPFSYAIFASSLLFPLLALLALLRAWGASEAGIVIRVYAFLTSLAILAFSAYAASIGWVGAQTWTM